MSSVGKDSQWHPEMLLGTERGIVGVSPTDRRTKCIDYRKNHTEIDKMIIMLTQYRINNMIRRNYPRRNINMLKHIELLSDLNLKQKELIQLKQELLRVKNMKLVWQQPRDEMV